MPAGALTGVNREFTFGAMIVSFRHKGLRKFHEADDRRGLDPEHADKLRLILTALEATATIADLDIPGFRCHSLSGRLQGHWAITVRANWRIVLRFEDGDAYDVDLLDYH